MFSVIVLISKKNACSWVSTKSALLFAQTNSTIVYVERTRFYDSDDVKCWTLLLKQTNILWISARCNIRISREYCHKNGEYAIKYHALNAMKRLVIVEQRHKIKSIEFHFFWAFVITNENYWLHKRAKGTRSTAWFAKYYSDLWNSIQASSVLILRWPPYCNMVSTK